MGSRRRLSVSRFSHLVFFIFGSGGCRTLDVAHANVRWTVSEPPFYLQGHICMPQKKPESNDGIFMPLISETPVTWLICHRLAFCLLFFKTPPRGGGKG